MKRIIAILLAAIMCFAIVGCNGAGKQEEILGDWIHLDEDGGSVKILADGTGTIESDGQSVGFTWEYDEENDKYNVTYDVTNRTGEIYIVTTEGITYLAGVLGTCFRAEDREAAVAAERAIMDAYIDRCMEGKTMLPLGEVLEANGATIEIKSIKLSEDKTKLLCEVVAVANEDLNRSKVMRLISGGESQWFSPKSYFGLYSGGASMRIVTDNGLAAGETFKTEIAIMQYSMLSEAIEKWGQYKGYIEIRIGENEYCIDLREYTKQ